MKIRLLILTLLLAAFSNSLHATVIYVDSAHVGGTQDGVSWATAYSNVQTAIDSAHAKDSIWVAKGTYQHYYTATAFAMKDSVKIFGGFLNTHTSFQNRDWVNNVTILKGNGDMVILNSFLNVVGPQAWLDGFTITGGVKGGMENSFSSPTVNNCTFTGNQNASTTSPGPAAMQNSACSSVITNCRFLSNQGASGVENAGFGAFPPGSNAGPTFVNCVFYNNSGSDAGGVVNSGCIVNYTNCDFTNNHSTIRGGAMYNTQALVNITNCRFNHNDATERGGGIYQDKCLSTITGCSFTGNTAQFGGGIANESDTSIRFMTLSNCSFDSNLVTLPGLASATERYGGGIYNRAKANISNCVFRNNAAGYNDRGAMGGGLYSWGNTANLNSNISNCQFYNNKTILVGGMSWYGANAMGGGALVNGGYVTDCIFEGNEAIIRGGGLAIGGSNSGVGVVNRCQFIGNKSQRGGGIFGSVTVAIYNSLLAKNVADSFGGGLAFDVYQGYDGKLTNNTITGNKAPTGGGVYLYAYTAITNTYKASNNIIWNNTSGIDKLTAIPAPSITYSLVQGVAANAATHVLSGSSNPLFVDTAAGNYQLLPASPCIDMGRNDSLAAVYNTDLLGHSRIYNTTIDMGAYEYGIFLPVATLGADTTVCSNIRLTLRLPYQAGTSFAWSTGDTTSSINISTPGKYYVTVSNIVGTASDTIYVRHNAAPLVALGNDTSVCGLVLLNAKNPGATYLWSNNATSQTIQVGAGTWSVLVTDTNSCRSADTIKVIQLPVPVVNLGADIAIVQGSSATLDAGNPGASYLWNTSANTQTITVSTAGTYSVTVTNSVGCSGTDEIVVTTIPLGVSGLASGTSVLSLHPNPAHNAVLISVNDPKLLPSKLTLYDPFGRAVRTVMVSKSEQQLSLEGLAPGIYLLRGGNDLVWKLVKE